jgi:hypothetical protein
VEDVDGGRVDSKREVLVIISEWEESSHIYSLEKDENLLNIEDKRIRFHCFICLRLLSSRTTI